MTTVSSSRIPLFERLEIESQSNCNRSCWFCPRTYDRSGKYLDETGKSVIYQMPTEKILDLLDQAQGLGFKGRVGFHHYSEPLIDERNIMLAQQARKREMKPYLHTNGDMLKRDNALCEEVNKVYGLIVVGLYDYETNEELEEMKRYWHDLDLPVPTSSSARSAHWEPGQPIAWESLEPWYPRIHAWPLLTSPMQMHPAIVPLSV